MSDVCVGLTLRVGVTDHASLTCTTYMYTYVAFESMHVGHLYAHVRQFIRINAHIHVDILLSIVCVYLPMWFYSFPFRCSVRPLGDADPDMLPHTCTCGSDFFSTSNCRRSDDNRSNV